MDEHAETAGLPAGGSVNIYAVFFPASVFLGVTSGCVL